MWDQSMKWDAGICQIVLLLSLSVFLGFIDGARYNQAVFWHPLSRVMLGHLAGVQYIRGRAYVVL